MTNRSLPREIKLRLVDVRRHFEALELALEQTTPDDFAEARRAREPTHLAQRVYPVERGFEILCNYVAELAELGLLEAGITPGDRPTNLRLLAREGVIGERRCRALRAAIETRNDLQHEYPDVLASGVFEAAQSLVAELPGYLADYAAWLRRLGFGSSA